MKALMVYPEFPDTFWSFKHALKFIHKPASLPPLGLLTVAAMLPKPWEKRLVDLNVRKLQTEDLAWADLVLVSGMIAQRDSAHEVVARCREAHKTVVAGGPLFTFEQEQFPEVDHFVLHEAEATLPGFLQDLERGAPKRVYAASGFPDLHQTPSPLWELADLRRYASMSLQFSRGCPFDCEFCNITSMFGRRPRTKTVAQVIAELDRLYQLGWRGSVFFVDDNFIGNTQSLKRGLLPALIQWQQGKRSIPFFTEASINLADDAELMGSMVKAGFRQVFVGIETPEEASLAECNKRQNRGRDLVADVKRIQRAGMEVQGGFIVGFDSDTPTIFKRQIDFIQKSGIVTAMVGLLQALPGTKLHHRLSAQGRLLGDTTGDNVDGTTNFISQMNPEVLRQGYRNLMDHLYSPGPYYRRVRTFLREYRPARISGAISWLYLLAFIHANLRLGVLGRGRFYYWQLMIWTVFRRPTHLALAVTLCIYGHHFRKIAKVLES